MRGAISNRSWRRGGKAAGAASRASTSTASSRKSGPASAGPSASASRWRPRHQSTRRGLSGDSHHRHRHAGFGRLPFTVDQPARKKSGIGLAAWAGGEYQLYPLSSRWRLRAGCRHPPQGIPLPRVRPHDARRPSDRAALADRPGHRGEPARRGPPALDLRRGGFTASLASASRRRRRLTARMTANAQVSRARAERRYEERDHLDGPLTSVSIGAGHRAVAHAPRRCGARPGVREARGQAAAKPRAAG